MTMTIKSQSIPIRSCIAIDCEGCLIRPGLPAPPLVCTSTCLIGAEPTLERQSDVWGRIMEILDGDQLIVGHNFTFDVLCFMAWGPREIIPKLFKAYDDDRMLDTMYAHRLITIETGVHEGRTGIDSVAPHYGLQVPKDIEHNGRKVRLSYGQLMGLPISEYPEPYVRYAKDDTRLDIELFERMIAKGLVGRKDLAAIGRTGLAASLTSAWGLRCDPDRVSALADQARKVMDELQEIMIDAKFMRRERNKPEPVRTMVNIRAAIAKAYGITDKLTDKCKWKHWDLKQRDQLKNDGLLTDKFSVSTDKTVLARANDPLLAKLSLYGEWSAVLNKDLRIFQNAIEVPFHTRYGFAETLRWTSSNPNTQNFRKKAGVRECMRPFWDAFVATDFVGGENATLAQVIRWKLGRRACVDKYNSGWDEHAAVGANVLGIGYEQMMTLLGALDKEAKEARQFAKAVNFGCPGGLKKPSTMVVYARGMGIELTEAQAARLIEVWYQTQPDKVAYLNEYVRSLRTGDQWGDPYTVPLPGTDIIRRGVHFNSAANTGFQAPLAVVEGIASYEIVKAQTLGLMPGKQCMVVHDENVTDCKTEDVPEVEHWQKKFMLGAARQVLPDIDMRVETAAMSHLSKGAKTLRNAAGQLQVHQV